MRFADCMQYATLQATVFKEFVSATDGNLLSPIPNLNEFQKSSKSQMFIHFKTEITNSRSVLSVLYSVFDWQWWCSTLRLTIQRWRRTLTKPRQHLVRRLRHHLVRRLRLLQVGLSVSRTSTVTQQTLGSSHVATSELYCLNATHCFLVAKWLKSTVWCVR